MPIVADEIKTLVERACTEGHVLVHGVDWDFYEAVLEEVGDRRIFVTYDRGELEIMPPSEEHEEDNVVIGRLIVYIADELGLAFRSLRSTTWKRKDLDCGAEADDCYYFQSYPKVPLRKKINLQTDPPPDLVLEVDISHRSLKKDAIYARLGVPELWRCDNGRLSFYHLKAGKYVKRSHSLVFPAVASSDLEHFVKLYDELHQPDARREFIKWIRKNLKKSPRRRS